MLVCDGETHTTQPHNKTKTKGVDPEAEEKRRRDEEEAARAAARAHGTPVTVEAFMQWKERYEAGVFGRRGGVLHGCWCWLLSLSPARESPRFLSRPDTHLPHTPPQQQQSNRA